MYSYFRSRQFGQFDLRVNVYFCGENVLASEPELNSTIVFYPNPAADRIHWTHPETVARVVCLNAMGQIVDAPQIGDDLDVSRLPNGIYFMRVTTALGTQFTQKVCVRH